ncbi:MAG: hypothetical protein GXO73_09050 [Calditrichaeota bacterium]|nr:hypothetical protein [Calditrichota bacterium]
MPGRYILLRAGFALSVAAVLTLGCSKPQENHAVKALYGFDPSLPLFQGLTGDQIAQKLVDWGVNAVFGGYRDSALVEALHARGIKVYAEIGFFVGEKLWEKYPQSRPIKADGLPLEKIEWYAGVTPTISEVQEDRLNALRELLKSTRVDGVWLDFIRWPAKWERPDPILPKTSFDPVTLKQFEEKTGVAIPESLTSVPEIANWILTKHEPEWTRFRCEVIADVVARARAICDEAGRPVTLGLFEVPWTADDFGGALLKTVGQDPKRLGEFVDVFSPMVYHGMCGQPVDWIARVTTWVHETSGKPVWPIVQSLDKPEKMSAEEFARTLETALKAKGSSGVIIFTLRETSPDKLEAMRRVFRSLDP